MSLDRLKPRAGDLALVVGSQTLEHLKSLLPAAEGKVLLVTGNKEYVSSAHAVITALREITRDARLVTSSKVADLRERLQKLEAIETTRDRENRVPCSIASDYLSDCLDCLEPLVAYSTEKEALFQRCRDGKLGNKGPSQEELSKAFEVLEFLAAKGISVGVRVTPIEFPAQY